MAKLETKELAVSKNGEATIIASYEFRFDSNSANGRQFKTVMAPF